MRKASYGLADAPRRWWLTIDKVLKSIGGKSLPGDASAYVWHDKAGELIGQVVLHVDDGLSAGTDDFISTLHARLGKEFGLTDFKSGSFRFCGIQLTQDPKSKEIKCDQAFYADLLEPIKSSRARLAQVDDDLTATELKEVQSVNGALLWLCNSTRPDLATACSEIAGTRTVRAIKLVNKAVAKAKVDRQLGLCYKRLDGKLELRAWTDASWANMPGLRSQQGQVLAICGPTTTRKTRTASEGNLLLWRSSRIKRVVRSTFAAETLAAVDTVDNAVYVKAFVAAWDGDAAHQPYLTVYSDCKSLVDNLQSINVHVAEKRLILDLYGIKEAISDRALDAFKWVPTEIQLSDSLTKVMDAPVLRTAVSEGVYPTMDTDTKRQNRAVTATAETQRMQQAFLNLFNAGMSRFIGG